MSSKYKEEHIEFIKSINNGIYNKEMTDLFNKEFGMDITPASMQNLRNRQGIKLKALKHSRQYTDEQVAYIEKIALGRSNKEIARLFNEKFNSDRTARSVATVKYKNKIASFPNKGRKYKKHEIEYLKHISKGRSNEEIARLFNEKFQEDRTVASINAIRYENGAVSGVETKFKKGQESENKMDIGSEAVTSDGYTIVKIKDEGKVGDWKAKHIIKWEEENGPVPDGNVVIFADKDRSNLDMDNLICISRSQLARLNYQGLIKEDAELTRTAINIVDLQAEIHEREKNKEEV